MASDITNKAQMLISQILEETDGLKEEDFSVEVSGEGSKSLRPLYAALYNNPRVVEVKPNKDNWALHRRLKTEDGEKILEDITVTRTIQNEEVDVSVGALRGVILHIESTASLGWYDINENKGVNICGVVGRNINDEDSEPLYTNNRIEKVFPAMHSYDSGKDNGPCNEPHGSIVNLDLLGSRGETCVSCIRNGHNKTLDNEGKTVTCKPQSSVYMYVTEVLTTVKKGRKGQKKYEVKGSYPISDVTFKDSEDNPLNAVFDEEGNLQDNTGFIVKFTFSPMRIMGKVTANPRALGLDGYLRALKRLYGNENSVEATLANPKMWVTTISTIICTRKTKEGEEQEVSHPYFNIEGGINIINNDESRLGFEYTPVEDLSAAVMEYSELRPDALSVWDSVRGEFDPKMGESIDPIERENAYNENFGDTPIEEDSFDISNSVSTAEIEDTSEQDIMGEGYFNTP